MTFVGGAIAEDNVALSEHDLSCSLANAGVGDRLIIQRVKGSQSTVQQLQRLGLRSGRMVTVLSCADSGSVIVACPQGNVGLGAAIARQIRVSPRAEVEAVPDRPLVMPAPGKIPAT